MLVSVVVITYNSSRYVLETLNSVYNQTYSDIELIISDDCSTYDTLTICKEWLSTHQERFIQSTITQTLHNGGICYNYNYALKLVTGEYIKYIAGDDHLKDNCLETFIKESQKSTFINLWYCAIDIINEDGKYLTTEYCKLQNDSPSKQFKSMLLNHYSVHGPSLFVNKKLLVSLNGFDERFPMVEDWPIAMKFLQKGYQIGIIPMALVQWRSYNKSVSKVNMQFIHSLNNAIHYYSRYLLKYGLLFHWYNEFVNHFIDNHFNKNISYRILGYTLRLFDILQYKRKLTSTFHNCSSLQS